MPNNTLTASALTPQLSGLPQTGQWYVAFSGGLDSSVLLHLLFSWCREHAPGVALRAVHVNHGLQAEAAQWQQHCQSFCTELGLELVSAAETVAVDGRGVEAAARQARYGVFESLLSSGDLLFMGHHLDDQVETVFLRLLRGAGVRGLAGMPPTRVLGQGRLYRPLLAWSRAELEQYAAAHELRYIDDPSNTDKAMDRNFLRHQVLPLIASRWPAYRGNVARTVDHLTSAAQSLSSLADHAGVINDWGDPGLPLVDLLEPGDQLQEAIRAWLDSQALAMPDTAALAEFVRQLRDASPEGHPRLDTGDYVLQRYRQTIYLLPETAKTQTLEEQVLRPQQPLVLDGIGELELVTYNPKHRWYYASELQPDEVLLIKTYDSIQDGTARRVAHTAFENPLATADAPPRESVESRMLVFF